MIEHWRSVRLWCFSERDGPPHLHLLYLCSGSELRVKLRHSESVARVFFSMHKLATVTYLPWVMESHSLICSLSHSSLLWPRTNFFMTISQGSTYREVLICHPGQHFWACLRWPSPMQVSELIRHGGSYAGYSARGCLSQLRSPIHHAPDLSSF